MTAVAEGEPLDGGRHAALVVAERDGPSQSLQRLDGVPHHHRNAGVLQHLAVVEVVADRHHGVARQPLARHPLRRASPPWCSPRAVHVDQREVPRLVFRDGDGHRTRHRQISNRRHQLAHPR
ncbi:MAG: hypothetical protein MZV64_30795 [Ignavibacteriales bacterium]|nr:hypothetical protein [Ignavibacteriales bacterium]